MPVTQRGGSFEATLNKAKRRWRFSFATQIAAEGWLADAKAALANGRTVPEPNGDAGHGVKASAASARFDRATDQFYNDSYIGSDSDWPKAVQGYLKFMREFFGPDATVREVFTQDKTNEFTRKLFDMGQAQSTVNSKLSIYSMMAKWAKKKRLIDETPDVTIRKPNNQRIGYLQPADEENLLRLLRQFGLDDAVDTVITLIDTGLRPKELLALKGRDFQPASGGVAVRKSKNDESRTVVATARTRAILARRLAAYGSDKLFPTMTKARLRAAWDQAREVMGRSDDPDFVPYICRHTCASRLVQRGIPLSVVMLWMGHKSIQMTMRYAKHAPADFAAAALALEGGPTHGLQVINGGAQ